MNRLNIAEWLTSSVNDDEANSADAELFNPENQKGVRAALAQRHITHKKLSIKFHTPEDVTLAAQDVRVESANNTTTIQSETGKAPLRLIIVFGIRNHPILPDTIIDQGYWFSYDEDTYYVMDIILTHGEVQALCRTPG